MSDKCKTCKKPIQDAFKPFCSKRCSDVDLHRWLKGNYVIAGNDGEAAIPANDADPDRDPDLY
jgi:endogenous inhibitor of DNA gyrase (YacG/DUF329 family)